MPLNLTRRAGFSLLEMSIVLVILGLLTAGGLSIGGIMVAQQANTSTNENLDEIQQALIDFVKTQGRLPCVAPLTVDPANTTPPIFGTELAAEGCLDTTAASGGSLRAVDGTGTRIVRIGGVPTRTLGLKDRMASDEFGNRFLYVVTENLTTHAGFNTATNLGQIGVRDGGGGAGFILDPASPNGGAAFMLISHGPDGKGAVRHKTGTVVIGCGSGTLDEENCNLSSTDITFRDARFNNGDLPASFFDDFTRFMPKYRLTALAGSSGSNLWGNNGDTIFSIGNDNNTTTGNVGIGTTAPSQNLHVLSSGAGNQTAMQIGTGVGSLFLTHNWASISSNLRYDDGQWRYEAAGPGSIVNMSSANGDIVFQTAASGAAGAVATITDRMLITSSGFVGIGTNGPTSLLALVANPTTDSGNDIAISSFSDVDLSPGFVTSRARGTSSAPTAIQFNDTASAFTGFGYNGSVYVPTGFITTIAEGAWTSTTTTNDSAMRFGTTLDGAPAERMRITSAGRVGIGYTNPSAMLDVNGSIASDQFTIPSDARLKHDIHPIFAGEGLKIIDGLTPVRFIWNKNDKPDIGLIAQEVEKYLPQAVEKTDDGMLRVTYDKIILPVITAIQDLHEIVKKLASQITAMAERQSALENRLTALEAENAALREEVKTLKIEKQN